MPVSYDLDTRGAQNLLRELPDVVRRGVKVGGFIAEGKIKDKAPVGITGNHKASIYTTFHDERYESAAHINNGSDYGRYLEDGTHKMAARPHFRPGLLETQKPFEAIIRAAVKGLER